MAIRSADVIKMIGRRRGVALLAAVFILIALAGWRWQHARLHLAVVECDSDIVLLSMDVRAGTEFTIHFLHSYDRAYFEEHYRVLGAGRILLTHMTFKSTLNGEGFELGTYRSRPDGSAELADINQEIGQVNFRLGSPDLANHALLIHGQRIRLLDYAPAGDLLCIRVQSKSYIPFF